MNIRGDYGAHNREIYWRKIPTTSEGPKDEFGYERQRFLPSQELTI